MGYPRSLCSEDPESFTSSFALPEGSSCTSVGVLGRASEIAELCLGSVEEAFIESAKEVTLRRGGERGIGIYRHIGFASRCRRFQNQQERKISWYEWKTRKNQCELLALYTESRSPFRGRWLPIRKRAPCATARQA